MRAIERRLQRLEATAPRPGALDHLTDEQLEAHAADLEAELLAEWEGMTEAERRERASDPEQRELDGRIAELCGQLGRPVPVFCQEPTCTAH